jgi:murein DD-endopeptidase MepM/ murein hydrolase activator NlpD
MHLSQRAVRVGDSVRKGQLIGRVGSTGFSTGPHLHWEIRIGWEPVDPYKIVRGGLNF